MLRRAAAAAFVLVALATSCSRATPGSPTATGENTSTSESLAGTQPAPEFPEGLDWLNTGGVPLRMADLRGKFVLLDFWTYGCINCIHIIPDLTRLEEDYGDLLVVIGVHSAKFTNEAATANIRQVILRYGLDHAVVNDRDFEVWHAWGANAWPTIALVDPAGNVVGVRAGEGVYDAVQPVISSLLDEFSGQLDATPLGLRREREGLPATILSYPGKVLATANELFIADTKHNRIVRAALPDANVTAVYGSGRPGLTDGPPLAATFNAPQGLALSADGSALLVADTNNHSVRSIDLATGQVSTLVGTGRQAAYPPTGGIAPLVDLSSPWDLAVADNVLYVAMAGTHQIWTIDLVSDLVQPFAGSGGEGSQDGPAMNATLAQPSGLTLDGAGRLYLADSESSSIRYVDTTTAQVDTIVGAEDGLFAFGDVDGVGTDARMQHPLGVAWGLGRIYVADTYNSKLKEIDPVTRELKTVAGGAAGWKDGSDPLFFEPGGVSFAAGRLYIADTNNNVIRVFDPESGDATTLVLKGIEAFTPTADEAGFRGEIVQLPSVAAAPGPGTIILDIALPGGYKVNEEAPSNLTWSVDPSVVSLEPDASLTAVRFPLEFPVSFGSGAGPLTADVNLIWCADDAESLCYITQLRLVTEVTVGPGGAGTLTLTHTIDLPPSG